MKKLLATMLALVMALTLCATAWAAGTVGWTTDGSNNASITITTAEQLKAVADDLRGRTRDSFATVTIKIDADLLNFAAVTDWTPFSLAGYQGVYTAGSFTIIGKETGTTIKNLGGMLISTVDNAIDLTCKNLTIDGATVSATGSDIGAGAFVGMSGSGGAFLFENCKVKNSAITGEGRTGGFVGYIACYDGDDADPEKQTVTFANCEVNNCQITGGGAAGGLIGHGMSSNTMSLTITGAKVTNNVVTCTEIEEGHGRKDKVGAIFGTVGSGQTSNQASVSAIVSGNDVGCSEENNGRTNVTTIYGRGVNKTTLTLTGGSYDNLPLNSNDKWASVANGVAGAKVTVDGKATYIYGADAISAVAKPGATIEVLNGSVTIDGETYDAGKTVTILNKYTVTFDSNGGSAVDAQTVKDGAMATQPTAPTKTGYTFAGWFAKDATAAFDFAKTTITADTTLTAKWDAKKSTATISTGSGSTTAGSQNITAGQEFTLEEKNTVAGSNTPTTSATFNGTAASVIVEGANDATELNLTVVAAAGTNDKNVADENKAAYEAATENATSTANAVVVSIDLKAITNDTVTPLFTEAVDGAYAIVKVPYKTGMKADSVTVTHLDTDGQTTALTRSTSANLAENNSFYYDSTTGVITLRLPHFSQYLINAEKASSGTHYRPILSGGATAADTVKDKAESPKTFDAGIAIYGVMAISSVLGMGYMGKKKF